MYQTLYSTDSVSRKSLNSDRLLKRNIAKSIFDIETPPVLPIFEIKSRLDIRWGIGATSALIY